MTRNLKTHYERKYLSNHLNHSAEVTFTDTPTNRFEAALSIIPKIFNGGDVLELGGGDGAVAIALLKRLPAINTYTLSELVTERFAEIQSRTADSRLRTTGIDIEASPDGSMQYDLIIVIALIEHLVDPLRAMQSVKRMLKPGGLVYIDTPNIAKLTRRIKLCLGQFPSTATQNEGLTTYQGGPVDLHDEGHLHYFTYRSLQTLLTEYCGFTDVRRYSYAIPPLIINKRVHGWLASCWPQMFSEIVVAASA